MKFDIIKPRLPLIILIIIIITGFILRMGLALEIPTKKLSGDAKNYDIMTKQILEKGVYGYLSDKPNSKVTPGYPMFLALIYKIFGYTNGSPFTVIRIIQAILGTASIFLIFLIGSYTVNRRVGILSALFYAFYPPYIQSVSFILTEVIYTFLFLLYFWIQLKALETKNKWVSITAGAAFALTVLTRPVIFPLIIVPFIYQWFVTKDKKIVQSFIYTLIGMIVLMIPWWVRNILVFGKIILLSSGSGNPMYAGVFPHMVGWTPVPEDKQFESAVKAVINGFLTQPITYLRWFTIEKIYIMFKKPWYDHATMRTILNMHYFIAIIGSIGIPLAIVEKRIRYISLYIVLLIGLQLMFIPEPRYIYPIMPFFMILTAYIIDYLFIESRKKEIEKSC
ncbi:MAG: ArnT family glycosyltransferase [Ignavibacteriales bacterium]